jgi:hypothetical protein
MDFLGQWLSDLCEIGPEFTVSASDAYVSYRDWARVFGLKPWSNPVFGRKLKERFHACRKADGIHYSGFRKMGYRPHGSTIQKAEPVLVPQPAAPLTAQEAVANAAARAACAPKGR